MSSATTLEKNGTPTDEHNAQVKGPATRPVTLVIQYGEGVQHTQIMLRVTTQDAVNMVNSRKNSICSRVEYAGVDLNGNPYFVEIGSQAVALYIQG